MNSQIENCLQILEHAISNKNSLKKSCQDLGYKAKYISRIKSKLDQKLEKGTITEEEYDQFHAKYNEYLDLYNKGQIQNTRTNSVEYDSQQDDNYESRCVGESLRDENKYIYKYYFNIKVSNGPDVEGYLSRDEMQKIHELYSKEGSDLSKRDVAREFPRFVFRDFERILRAFQITKASIPVAPHVLEEMDEEKAIELTFQNKEKNYLKKFDHERSKYFEKAYFRVLHELNDIKKNYETIENTIKEKFSDLEIEPLYIEEKPIYDEKRSLFVYISDQHIGAETKEESIYDNDYDEDTIMERMNKTLQFIYDQYSLYGVFDRIVIFNLGDCLDGFNQQTTRGGHMLPQNMNNKEQYNFYIKVMTSFFENLYELDICNNIDFFSIGDSNHGGDFEYIANKSLEHILSLKFPDIFTRVCEKFIEHFRYGDHTFIVTHGKDKEDRKSGFPFNLDDKTENYFNDYIDRHKIRTESISVIKGDLHSSSTEFGKRFRYKNVMSMYGGSKWIHTNFGSTYSGVDMEVINKERNLIKEARLFFE